MRRKPTSELHPSRSNANQASDVGSPGSTPLTFVVKSFEKLSTRELHDLLRLRIDVFVVEQECAYPEIDGKDPLSTHLLGYVDSDLAVYARWYTEGNGLVLGRITTRQDLRGQGLGRLLMAKVFDSLDPQEIRISAQRQLESYYRDMGFETVSELYDDFGIPHIDMVRGKR